MKLKVGLLSFDDQDIGFKGGSRGKSSACSLSTGDLI